MRRSGYIEEMGRDVEEGCAFGCEGPLVEIGEVGIRVELSEVDVGLTYRMCPIHKYQNVFGFEVAAHSLHWHHHSRH
jgi:hypothetical protein